MFTFEPPVISNRMRITNFESNLSKT